MTLVWASGYNGITDPDAQTYIAAVETADGQAIEGDVALAINDFVVGCKDDGIWDAIKASCILAGARTLSGALVPLKGTAPTNYNFVSGDYNRETGLKGDGSTKYLDSNRNNDDDPRDSNHNAAWTSEINAGVILAVQGTANVTGSNVLQLAGCRNRNNNIYSVTPVAGFFAHSRNTSSSFSVRNAGVTSTVSRGSQAPSSQNLTLYHGSSPNGTHRLSFYSIGESIDLEKLDNRTTRLMNLISYSLASGLPDLSTMDLDAASYIGAGYRAGGTLS